jgi:hypothetical protein
MVESYPHQSTSDDDAPLWGALAIGQAIGRSERQTFHALERGFLPATKVGKSWVTTKRRLLDRILGAA